MREKLIEAAARAIAEPTPDVVEAGLDASQDADVLHGDLAEEENLAEVFRAMLAAAGRAEGGE